MPSNNEMTVLPQFDLHFSPAPTEEVLPDDGAEAERIIEAERDKAKSLLEKELRIELQTAGESSGDEIRVAMIGGNEQYYRSVLTRLKGQYPDVTFVKYIVAGGKNAFYAIDSLKPDILLVYYRSSLQTAIQLYDAIQTQSDSNGVPYRKKYEKMRMVVIAPDDFHYVMELQAKGIQFIILENDPRLHTVDTENLMSLIHEAYADISAPTVEMALQGRENTYAAHTATRQTPQIPVRGVGGGYVTDDVPTMPHKIIGVYSATGGSGKTMFATNLASILAKYSSESGSDYRVCLLEYNLACKNVDLFFNIKTTKSIAKLAQDTSTFYKSSTGIAEVEPRQMIPLINKYIEHMPDTGLDILAGITVPLEIDRIGKNFTNCLFPALREMYDVVIVDMSTDIAKTPMLEALNETDEFYYLMPMDVPSIRNTKVLIKFLTGMFKKSQEEIKVILNKVNPENEEFGVDQVYAVLASDNCVPEGTIPYDEQAVLSSINKGKPIALSDPENPVSKAIFSIALGINPRLNMEMVEDEQESKQKTGVRGKLFKKKNKEEKEEKPKLPARHKEGKKKSFLSLPRRKEKEEGIDMVDVKECMPADSVAELPKLNFVLKGQEEETEEEPPKKKGFIARLLGFGEKKKKKPQKQKKSQGRSRLSLRDRKK